MEGGCIEATIKTLGYFFRTSAMEPRFPLLCHDRFFMEGYFSSVDSMTELERVLAAEQVEITLWQSGRRLAHFVGKLSEVMQTSLPKMYCEHNVNVQLLMKPSAAFPGMIAPKIELSAQVGVKDRVSGACQALSDLLELTFDGVSSTQRYHNACQQSEAGSCGSTSYLRVKRKQQPVCHARDTSENVKEKSEDDLSLPKSQERRLSNCTSVISNISYPSTHITAAASSSSSGCSASKFRLSRKCVAGLESVEEHQLKCEICQAYQKVFQLPRKFSVH